MRNKIQHEYYTHDVYFFCQCVKNIVCDNSNYLHGLNEFYGDGKIDYFSKPFPKYSYLHEFIEFTVRKIHEEDLENEKLLALLEKMKNLSNLEFSYLNNLGYKPIYSFIEIYKKFSSYMQNLGRQVNNGELEDIKSFFYEFLASEEYTLYIDNLVNEIFYVLFSNKLVMHKFNEMMADAREVEVDGTEHPEFTDLKGRLKRKNIPIWVKNAVFHRDKGRCVLCKNNVSVYLNQYDKKNFDHIVPLAMYGLNDISNIQLLCTECNQVIKRGSSSDTSYEYFLWYEMPK